MLIMPMLTQLTLYYWLKQHIHSHYVRMDSMLAAIVGFPITQNRGAQQEFCLNKSFKKIVPFQQAQVRTSYLGVRCKETIQLDCRSRIKNLTATPSVLRNPTSPKNLRLLATPIPQLWLWVFAFFHSTAILCCLFWLTFHFTALQHDRDDEPRR